MTPETATADLPVAIRTRNRAIELVDALTQGYNHSIDALGYAPAHLRSEIELRRDQFETALSKAMPELNIAQRWVMECEKVIANVPIKT